MSDTREPPVPGGVREWLLEMAADETLPPEEREGAAHAAEVVSDRPLTEREYRRGAELAAEVFPSAPPAAPDRERDGDE